MSNVIYGQQGAWASAQVIFRPQWTGGQIIASNFLYVVTQLVSVNYYYYTNVYYPTIFPYTQVNLGYWQQPYGNRLIVNGGYSSGGNGGGGLSLNIGGFFNF